MPLKWRSDFDKYVVISNLERRGWDAWVDTDPEDDFNVYWASVQSVKWLFSSESTFRLTDAQMVNHFPNHYELTRKDLMYKNMRQYRKNMRTRDGPSNGSGTPREGFGSPALLPALPAPWTPDDALDFCPLTFLLPQDYSLFLEEFKRQQAKATAKAPNAWILKPQGKSQGKGIQIVTKLSQIKKMPGARGAPDQYVISRYLTDPLLIGGKKFDLRMYVLVLAYAPLKAYISKLGFARFCNVRYSGDEAGMGDLEIHLTNVAVQKHGQEYNESHGNKWPLESLFLYLEQTHGGEAARKLQFDINALVYHSLKSCQGVVVSDRHCFELYGYDLLIDESLKPWLLEVNASPSLTTTTARDRAIKLRVVDDSIALAQLHRGWTDQGIFEPVRPSSMPGTRGNAPTSARGDRDRDLLGVGPRSASEAGQPAGPDAASPTPSTYGCFDLLVDETEGYERARREARQALQRARSGSTIGVGSLGRPTVFTGS